MHTPPDAAAFDTVGCPRRFYVLWSTTIGISAMHILCVLAFFPAFFSWSGVLLVPILWWICGGWGICLGYHRLLTHRSFETPRIVEYALTILGAMSWQGGPIQWVGTHRIHHKESDGPEDPHSPEHGFTWSHMLWCFFHRQGEQHPRSVTKDLQRDPVMVLIDRYHYVPQFVLAGVLFGLGYWWFGTWQGGMSWVVWGVAVRTVFSYHATWFVNSAAHTWGYRNFKTADGSKNNWWVAVISFGEGWHNNHHAQQRSAAHGMRWWEIDMTYWTIRLMELVGLAKRVVRPNLDEMASGK